MRETTPTACDGCRFAQWYPDLKNTSTSDYGECGHPTAQADLKLPLAMGGPKLYRISRYYPWADAEGPTCPVREPISPSGATHE